MRKEEIRERLEQLTAESLIGVWNEYQFEISGEDVIYSVYGEFDEICQDMSPTEIADNVCAGDFSTVDDYFQITHTGLNPFQYGTRWNILVLMSLQTGYQKMKAGKA